MECQGFPPVPLADKRFPPAQMDGRDFPPAPPLVDGGPRLLPPLMTGKGFPPPPPMNGPVRPWTVGTDSAVSEIPCSGRTGKGQDMTAFYGLQGSSCGELPLGPSVRPAPLSFQLQPQQLPPNFRSGDWMCPRCNFHNYKAKSLCVKCNTPMPAPPVSQHPPSLDAIMADPKKRFPWEGTSGQECRYDRSCKNHGCTDSHRHGRDIDDKPDATVCRFSRKCKRHGCFFVHPQGREVDEDPSKGMCRAGRLCKRPDCLYTHPEGREKEALETRQCHTCGESGHIMRDCPRTRGSVFDPLASAVGQHVTITGFPEEWQNDSLEMISAHITAELEVFGTLSLLPQVSQDGKAVAAFVDTELARAAVDSLTGVFQIELCEPPFARPQSSCSEGVIVVEGFPQHWQSSDIYALLRGSVKSSTLVAVDVPDGRARVRFRDFVSAKDAARDLSGQKVAGKPLTISVAAFSEGSAFSGKNAERDPGHTNRGEEGLRILQRSERDENGKVHIHVLHVDELDMPRRPAVEAVDTDRELFCNPLPDDDELDTCLAAFGDAEDVVRLPSPRSGKPSKQGYVKFKRHDAARRAVDAEFGVWSESERILALQRCRRSCSTLSAYPCSIIAGIVGSRGISVKELLDESGPFSLHLCGEEFGHSEDRQPGCSQRAHFVVQGGEAPYTKLKELCNKRLSDIHDAITEKLKENQRERDQRHEEQERDQPDRKLLGSRDPQAEEPCRSSGVVSDESTAPWMTPAVLWGWGSVSQSGRPPGEPSDTWPHHGARSTVPGTCSWSSLQGLADQGSRPCAVGVCVPEAELQAQPWAPGGMSLPHVHGLAQMWRPLQGSPSAWAPLPLLTHHPSQEMAGERSAFGDRERRHEQSLGKSRDHCDRSRHKSGESSKKRRRGRVQDSQSSDHDRSKSKSRSASRARRRTRHR